MQFLYFPEQLLNALAYRLVCFVCLMPMCKNIVLAAGREMGLPVEIRDLHTLNLATLVRARVHGVPYT